MTKADQLGAGRFGSTARPVSARRQAVAAATGVPTDGVAPPTELPPHRISLNPDNPRTSLGDLTDLAGSLKTHGQKQAITVMNRDAYIKANPEHAAGLEPDTTYVVVDGNSRLAGAREAGLTTIKVMVSDDQGTTSEEVLESALVANIHRQDLDELDEARALQRLLAIHGSQVALAKRLHRSQGWVSQRLALLDLSDELKERIGQEPIDLLRAVGKKPADQRQAALEALKAERARKEAEKPARRPGRQPKAAASAVEAATARRAGERDKEAGEKKPVPQARSHAEASLREEPVASPEQPRTLPYDDPSFIAMHLAEKMARPDFFKMLQVLSRVAQQQDPEEFENILRHPPLKKAGEERCLSRLAQSSRFLNEPSRSGFCLSEPSRAVERAGGAGWLYRLGWSRRARASSCRTWTRCTDAVGVRCGTV
ncbi:ParB/RepB/Spo0J family partition protein [Streptomyces sp. NPDC006476]|uniref:ParB/RepB/Spo0J family partition protein n=1 Tax=Streptomyces sp. NPDC006476 TaxID=3157175 RepID=UPI0033A71537